VCGINGIVRLSAEAPPIDHGELLATRDAMRSRGPDGEGTWTDRDGRLALGHRRLAILDPTSAGAQPMDWQGGRYRIVLNGEIYNFRELRRELVAGGEQLVSHSDTEVLLALYAHHGVAMLERLRGMYALALWDRDLGRLLLARDPYGIKPLYYAVDARGVLRFASQVAALLAGGGVCDAVDPTAVAGFLLWGSVPEPRTVRRAVRALPAGHYLWVEHGRVGDPQPYSLMAVHSGDQDQDEEALDPEACAVAAIEDSVRAHLVSDVPVAVFLSAGLDSGLIAALARRFSAEPPVSFTLRFAPYRGSPLDEGPLAAEVAAKLGTRHVERTVGREEFAGLWSAAIAAMDQPSIDGFNTFLVSRVAAEAGIKVVLSGLGGDELFGSYPSFADVPRWARWARRGNRLPGAAAVWPALARRLAPGAPKLRGLLRYGSSLPGAYFLRRGLFLPEELPGLLGPAAAAEALAAYDPVADAAHALPERGSGPQIDPWVAVHLMESARYMRNQLLRDADWASMSHSLELRVPLADARLRATLAAQHFEPARSRGKAALVRKAAPELPAELFGRPKSGFSIPVVEWMERGAAPLDRRPADSPGARSRRLALRVLRELGLGDVLAESVR
jgi:asparagine synthase (glutamine-hydrolysing)